MKYAKRGMKFNLWGGNGRATYGRANNGQKYWLRKSQYQIGGVVQSRFRKLI